MASKKPPARHNKLAGKKAADGKQQQKLKGAERSAYFARREAAKVLRSVLQGDARRRAVASIKSLVYSPAVRNKKATYALVCQTLKCKLATRIQFFFFFFAFTWFLIRL